MKVMHHKLLYYRYRPTGVEELKVRYVGESEQAYTKKELEKIYIREEEVRRFTLDKHGQPIPLVDGHMTNKNRAYCCCKNATALCPV